MPWKRKRIRSTACAVVLVALAAACSSAPAADPTQVADPTRSSPTPVAGPEAPVPEGVPEVLDFTAPKLGGGTLEGADFAGQDVAIWFWAPW